ncbi:DEAD-box family helicase, putative [Theileria annulata]|uniref:RNA helicase n=1 Tax=Theileria annulata TaxID=5874 RepID=Q4UHH1_THEAN|nr:DEAD-box family helicase, putative [Theileria annulata]CAI73468.1 DEAD-box family helicase, putative [Theileria annulata]|eukprot:XP_954145.1 DEAD-box family helicase, putative [Theileria annulata]
MEGGSSSSKEPPKIVSPSSNTSDNTSSLVSNTTGKSKEDSKGDVPYYEKYLYEMDLAVEASKGRNLNLKDNPNYLKRLRDEARRSYLERREEERLELARRELGEKEIVYDSKLRRDEFIQKSLKLDRERVKLAETAIKTRPTDSSVITYELPDSYDEDNLKRLEVIKKKQLSKGKDKPVSEQDLWESKLYKYGITNFGVVEEESKGRKLEEDSENKLIGDLSNFKDLVGDSINFILDSKMPEVSLTNIVQNHLDFESTSVSSTSDEESDTISREKRTSNKYLSRLEKLKKKQHKLMLQERQKLPIYYYRTELLSAIKKYKTLIVVGETGSGKTTQIPQYLHEVGYSKAGVIGITQPRRVAAMSVATRVSKELNVKMGSIVGYSIRFEDYTGSNTKIKYMTDGILLREFTSNPTLENYSVIIIDEAHERTLHTDVIFGLVKDLIRYRDDFRLIISSATLEAEKFALYFDNAPIFKIPGRRYPVQIYYTKAPEANYLDASIITILQIHLTQPIDGDILVFLPGQQEIEYIQEELIARLKNRKDIRELIILSIYSSLPSDMQNKIFEPTPENSRKVILSTNISETSITLDNIVYVIDTGFCKLSLYSPKTGLDSLIVVPCSKANANQRSGRAGRVRAGHCFRLYTKLSYDKEMDDNHEPEIKRVNLSSVVLLLKSIGIDDLLNFDFMDPPSPESLINSLELIYSLGCLNDSGELTKLGKIMSELPLDPMYSKSLLFSIQHKCHEDIIIILSMLIQSNNIFYIPKDRRIHAENNYKNFYNNNSDHLMLLNVYNQWKENDFSIAWCYENYLQYKSLIQIQNIIQQLQNLITRLNLIDGDSVNGDVQNNKKDKELGSNMNYNEVIMKCIVSGFFVNVAVKNEKKSEKNYKTIKSKQLVYVHPNSSVFKQNIKFVVYNDLVLTTKHFIRQVSEIQAKWLMELAPHYYQNIKF